MGEISKYCKLRPDGLLEAGKAYLADKNEYAAIVEVVGTPEKFSGNERISAGSPLKASVSSINSDNLGKGGIKGQEAKNAKAILHHCNQTFMPT